MKAGRNNIQLNIRRKAGAFVLIFLLAAGFSACGNQKEPVQSVETVRTVVDCTGRSVEIPEKVERVACLYAFAGHITALLGEEKKIVAVVEGLKRDKLLTNMFPDILDKAVPFSDGAINMEELAKLDPDVVFIRESTAENQAEMEKLEAFGLPAVVVDSNTLEEQRASVLTVGEVFGGEAQKKAGKYDEFFREAIRTVGKKTEEIQPGQAVTVFHSINEATRTDVKGTLPAQWMSMVGVVNVSADQELSLIDGKSYAGLEQIYRWDPEFIICNEPGVGEYILTDRKWAGLQAVKNHNVYQMPVAISRWGHPGSMETPLAMYWLGKLVYPELYSDIDLSQKIKEFYQTFFNYTLSDEEVSGILSGVGMRLAKNPDQ